MRVLSVFLLAAVASAPALYSCGIEARAAGLSVADAAEDRVEDQGPGTPTGPVLWQSGTRIRARVGVTPDGARMLLGWWDKDLGLNCEFGPAIDGARRCLPESVRGVPDSTLFADDKCTQMLVSSNKPGPIVYLVGRCDSESTKNRCYFKAGATHAGPLYANGGHAGDPCFVFTDSGLIAYEVGAQVDPDEFVGYDEVTE